jgi:hypothetical protein
MNQTSSFKIFYYKLEDGLLAVTITNENYDELFSQNITKKTFKTILQMFKDKKYALIHLNNEPYQKLAKTIIEKSIL